jgi:hypothetical protein
MSSDTSRVDRRDFIQASAGLAALAAGAAGTAQAQPTGLASTSVGLPLEVRRVVTGHRDNGDSFVAIDEIPSNVTSRREGMQAVVIWSTGESPADNADPEDGAARTLATSDDNGTVFRIVKYDPGVAPRNHRTQSIDYAVIMSGEITMRLNNGNEPCVVAFILCAARELEVGGRVLEATG